MTIAQAILATAFVVAPTFYMVGLAVRANVNDRLRKERNEARDAHATLANKHNAMLKRMARIMALPNNGKHPNGGLLKAQRIAGGEG